MSTPMQSFGLIVGLPEFSEREQMIVLSSVGMFAARTATQRVEMKQCVPDNDPIHATLNLQYQQSKDALTKLATMFHVMADPASYAPVSAPTPPPALTFAEFSTANAKRAREWKSDGLPPLGFACTELAGEVGELLNKCKKVMRTELNMPGGSASAFDLWEIADELADVVIAADLLSQQFGIDLGACVIDKFNKTSKKHNFETYLGRGPLPALRQAKELEPVAAAPTADVAPPKYHEAIPPHVVIEPTEAPSGRLYHVRVGDLVWMFRVKENGITLYHWLKPQPSDGFTPMVFPTINAAVRKLLEFKETIPEPADAPS